MIKKIEQFEIDLIKSLRNNSSSFLDVLMQIITVLGEQYVIILGLAVIYFLYDKKIGQIIAYSIFTTILVNNTLKGLIKYERPFKKDPTIKAVRIETATGYSFPSGHTQNATTFYSSICINFKLKNKKLITIITSIIIGLIAFSRVYLGVHYLKDVIVAIILGISISFICAKLYNLVYKNTKKTFILLGLTNIIFLPFLFIFYKNNYTDILIYRDFYLSYALFSGFICALLLDLKYVNFTTNTNLKKKLIRFSFALVCFLVIEFGLKSIFKLIATSIILDFIRYFLLTFVVLGLYPFLFRKTLFKD